jgi:hypothetical protein
MEMQKFSGSQIGKIDLSTIVEKIIARDLPGLAKLWSENLYLRKI